MNQTDLLNLSALLAVRPSSLAPEQGGNNPASALADALDDYGLLNAPSGSASVVAGQSYTPPNMNSLNPNESTFPNDGFYNQMPQAVAPTDPSGPHSVTANNSAGLLIPVATRKQKAREQCIDECVPILERPGGRTSDKNTWDFHRCVNECMDRLLSPPTPRQEPAPTPKSPPWWTWIPRIAPEVLPEAIPLAL